MAVDYSGLASAIAAEAAYKARLDTNYVGASPLGEMAVHKVTNKPAKKAAIDAYAANETLQD